MKSEGVRVTRSRNRLFARVSALLLAAALSVSCRSAGNVGASAPVASTSRDGAPAVAKPIVILVSIDGWRADYFARFNPKNLRRLAASGVRAEGLIPQFPSKTFPNHYTLVTGLRLPHHGIVSNNMVDPELPGRFSMANREVTKDPRWWAGEPFWNTVERQGGVAAAMFWPGSETAINGRQPTFWMPFDDTLPHEARIARLLEWLALPEGRQPSFLTLYFSDVDTTGHRYGPDSAEVRAAAAAVDASIGRLIAGVASAGLASRVNFVVVSDHGMARVTKDRVIVLDDFIDPQTVDVLDWSPVLALAPRDGDVERLYRALKGRHPAFDVYRSSEIPAEYGPLAGHPPVPPVVGIAKEGYAIASRREFEHWNEPGTPLTNGNHGYDPRRPSMWGLFVASGPGVASRGVVKPFENIHVYDFLCGLLRVQPAPNDGDPAVTRSFLRP